MERMRRTPYMPHISRRSTLGALLAGALLLSALGLLAACGGYAGSSYIKLTPPAGTATSNPAYAYLYSRIDYPLELPVNGSDAVTLTLSPQQNLLVATPGTGSGVATVGVTIPLPTRLKDYSDIGAAVDTESLGDSPIVWQLVSAPRQSLLTPTDAGSVRRYVEAVTFHWHVRAVAEGQNLVRVVLHLYFIYLDGSEHDGTIQVSASPVPIVATQASFLNTTLPGLRLPLAVGSGLAGLLGLLRFLWDVAQNAKEAKETAEGAARAAAAIHARVNQRRQQRPG